MACDPLIKNGLVIDGSGFDRARSREALDFIAATSQFFLNLSMVASKAIMEAAHRGQVQ